MLHRYENVILEPPRNLQQKYYEISTLPTLIVSVTLDTLNGHITLIHIFLPRCCFLNLNYDTLDRRAKTNSYYTIKEKAFHQLSLTAPQQCVSTYTIV